MSNGNGTDKVIDLIRKLLALSTSSNEHEAAAAAAKAQELLAKHELDMSQIQDRAAQEDAYVHFRRDTGGKQNQKTWRISLLGAVAKTSFCRVVFHTDGKVAHDQYTIVGKAHNIEVVEYLFTYLAGEITRLATAAWKAADPDSKTRSRWRRGVYKRDEYGDYKAIPGHYERVGVSAETWKRAFAMGAVATIAERLRAQRQEFTTSADNARALIVRTDRELDVAVRAQFPRLGNVRRSGTSANGAFIQGLSAGHSIGINPGVRGAASPGGYLSLGSGR